jgi:hypothetical protein
VLARFDAPSGAPVRLGPTIPPNLLALADDVIE